MNNTAQNQPESNLDIAAIKRSLGRSLLSQTDDTTFFELFYSLFLKSHPDITNLFSQTNLEKQYAALKNGLNMAIMFADGDQYIAKDVLEKIGRTHCRSKMNIKPEYYKYWVDSLIHTLSLKDEKFDETLEMKWREALQVTVDFITERY